MFWEIFPAPVPVPVPAPDLVPRCLPASRTPFTCPNFQPKSRNAHKKKSSNCTLYTPYI